jgi:cell division protein FtsB
MAYPVFFVAPGVVPDRLGDMPRRIRKKTSILAPAGNLLRKLSDTDTRLRRRILKASLWVLGLAFAYSLMFGTYSIPRIARLTLQKRSLIETNRELTAQLVDADRMRDLLKSDREYIEYVARTKYFMVRPGETIFRYRVR